MQSAADHAACLVSFYACFGVFWRCLVLVFVACFVLFNCEIYPFELISCLSCYCRKDNGNEQNMIKYLKPLNLIRLKYVSIRVRGQKRIENRSSNEGDMSKTRKGREQWAAPARRSPPERRPAPEGNQAPERREGTRHRRAEPAPARRPAPEGAFAPARRPVPECTRAPARRESTLHRRALRRRRGARVFWGRFSPF